MDTTTETPAKKLSRLGAVVAKVTEGTLPVAQLQAAGKVVAKVTTHRLDA